MDGQAQAAAEAAGFVEKFNTIILFPTIGLLSGIAFLVFIWGCLQYFINANNEQARQQGVKHITFGIIGLVVMMSAWAILSIVTASFGLTRQQECANNPTLSDCGDAFTAPEFEYGGGGGEEGGNDGGEEGGNDGG